MFLAGLVAACAVVVLAGRARRNERLAADKSTVRLLAGVVATRAESVLRAVRGPAMAFDLASLAPRELSGVLRLSYGQSDAVTAVTLLDRQGHAVVPAVFLARTGAVGTGGHPIESLDDLDRFARQIPLDSAIARGRAVRGPYPNTRGDSARVVFAEAVPVADGTSTWVLAAELDAAALVHGLAALVGDGEVALVTPAVTVGTLSRVPETCRNAIRELSRRARTLGEPDVLSKPGCRAAVMRAPYGLDGVLAVAWSGDEDLAWQAGRRDWALGVVVMSLVGALAAAMAVTMREASRGEDTPSARGTIGDLTALGVVVKELANPIAAMSAAARLLGAEPSSARVVEMVRRGAVRVERVFRRVARLARGGQEHTHTTVNLTDVIRREVETLRGEIEQGGYTLSVHGLDDACMVQADPDDMALLVQALLDGARAVAPPGSEIVVTLHGRELTVRDRGAMRARERRGLTALVEGVRIEGAASALAWALAARIATEHQAAMSIRDVEGDAVEVSVRFL